MASPEHTPDRTLRHAEAIARHAHAEQVDKSGNPYVGHLQRVAAAVADDPEAAAVAWLHDLVEDQPHCAGYLADMPAHIVRAVYLLTRTKGEPDTRYFARIKADPLALRVKLADVADNAAESRLAMLGTATATRLRKKYADALAALTPQPEATPEGDWSAQEVERHWQSHGGFAPKPEAADAVTDASELALAVINIAHERWGDDTPSGVLNFATDVIAATRQHERAPRQDGGAVEADEAELPREDETEDEWLIRRLSSLLARIALIVNGPEPARTSWGYADLPAKVAALAARGPDWLRDDMLALADGVERGEITGVVWPATVREWAAAIAPPRAPASEADNGR